MLLILLFNCTFYDRRLNIVNSSSDTISFRLTTNPYGKFESLKEYYLSLKLAPDSIKNVIIPGKSKLEWNEQISKSKNKRLYLYVINYDTLKHYSLDEIISEEKFIIYEYSKKQLDSMNWKISVINDDDNIR